MKTKSNATPSAVTQDTPTPKLGYAIGWEQDPPGQYTVVYLSLENGSVIKREVISGPEPRGIAMESMKIAIVRRLFLPSGSTA